MAKILQIPFTLRGIPNTIEVVYKANDSAAESGFDALPDLPFDPNLCLGYPAMHAYVKDMANTGYRRYCGWIQLIHREYCSSALLEAPDEDNVSIDSILPGQLYFACGYPAEIYDAPCMNLSGNAKGKWTAYTYLVDVPTRMNGDVLSYLAGFRWGYEEALVDGKLTVSMQDIEPVGPDAWRGHIPCMKASFPDVNFQ